MSDRSWSVCWRPRLTSSVASSLASERVTRPLAAASSRTSWMRSRVSTTRPSGLMIRLSSCSARLLEPSLKPSVLLDERDPPLVCGRCEAELDAGVVGNSPSGRLLVRLLDVPAYGVDQRLEQRFLSVPPVLGLIPDSLALPVEELFGDLLAGMGGQAVKRDRVRCRFVEQLLV